jgi:hypothetical protein
MHSASLYQVWRTLRAMPLRLLERVMPWLAAKLPEPDIEEMLATVRRHTARLLLHACLCGSAL